MSALNNANLSLGQVFNAVNTAAVSVDATFRVIGNMAQVAADKSGSWARITRKEIFASEAQRTAVVINEAKSNITTRMLELKRKLDADPEFAAMFAEVSAQFDRAEAEHNKAQAA